MAGLLAVLNEKKSPVFTFHLLKAPPSIPGNTEWIHQWHSDSGEITLSLAMHDGRFLLRFPSLADFIIDEGGDSIAAWPAPEADQETVRHLLLDQVMPRVLSHQGRLVLHASAVCVDGRALAFAGETGRGKSTLAASLHLAGYSLLTDDGLVLKEEDDHISAVPGYSGLRLLPESVSALFKESPTGNEMAFYSPKNRIAFPDNVEINAVELGALFILDKPEADEEVSAMKVEPLSQRDACMELVNNSFQLDVTNHKQVAGLFSKAAKVAEQLPVFALSYPRKYSSLPSVHLAVLQKLKNTRF